MGPFFKASNSSLDGGSIPGSYPAGLAEEQRFRFHLKSVAKSPRL
jgi:hypothetical protein